jgi:Flp pilus assembly protein TadG
VIRSIVGMMGRLRRDESGNIAMLFGLTLIPVAGAAGMGLDYSRASNYYTSAQSEVDAAVLTVAKRAVEVNSATATRNLPASSRLSLVEARANEAMSTARSQLAARYGSSIADIAVTGNWVNQAAWEYRIVASGTMTRGLSSIVPGVDKTQVISVGANARAEVNVQTTASIPTIDRPGYEAGDYNRIYVYCYSEANKNQANQGRTQMTAVSSNGTDGGIPETQTNPIFQNIRMPVCTNGETLSWRLYNVRGARTDKNRWPRDTQNSATGLWTQQDNAGENTTGGPTQRTIYNYYTDTRLDPVTGVESYQFNGNQLGYNAPINMMETAVCDTRDQCTPGRPGSTIPTGRNRTPQLSTRACSPGKVMYIGWEDRPVIPGRPASEYTTWGSGYWTDADYDDIRLVIDCPVTTTNFTSQIKLSK